MGFFSKKSTRYSLWSWIPRGLALLLVLTWALILIFSGLGHYFVAGLMILAVLILTTMISWMNAPIGGGIFILLGAGYLIFSMGLLFSTLYVIAAFPLFLTGSAFIVEYLYHEKKEDDDGGVDDF